MNFQNPGRVMLFLFEVKRFLSTKSIREYCESLDLKGNEKIMEIGSGTGIVTRYLSRELKRRGKVVCVDTSKALMDVARSNLRDVCNVEFFDGPLQSLNYADGSFDAAVIHYMLHDVDPSGREALLRSAFRLLAPKGTVYL
ncbi:MAG TPA: class I SAM-dependent methyltransferase, partial [Spirochaetota bacterium]